MTAAQVSMAEPVRPESLAVGAVVWRVLLLVGFVMLTIPQWVSQMGVGLDPSWITGLHLSADRGLAHGRDFIFTYGPLGFALCPKELGDLDLHSVAIRLGLNLFWWTSVGILLFRVKGYATPLVFAATMAISGIALDGEFNLSLYGAVILPVVGFLLLAELDRRPTWAIPAAFLAGAAILTKFNLGVACTAALGMWSLMRLARDPSRRVFARLMLLATVYFGSMIGFFLAYGGPLSTLWPFLQASGELASAYSTQMTADEPGNPGGVVAAIMLGLTVVGLVISLARRSTLTPAFVIMVAPMFILYKGAVVRQALSHFQLVWPVMVSLTALVLPAASRTLRTRVVATLVVATVLASGFWYSPTSVQKVALRGASNWIGLCKLDETRSSMRDFDARLKREKALPASMRRRIGDESVDVYPWETSYIWTNDLEWSPRPVFQSYCAYTPRLDQMGADHYRGQRAPKFILYTHYAIDSQHPCAVDSRTWIEMLRWYDCVDRDGDMLLLQRRVQPRWRGAERLESTSLGFVKSYEPPAAEGGHVFLKAKFELSLLGKLQAIFYKVDPPLIRVHYSKGEPANHRLVWRNAAGGFLVSSLPRDVDGVVRLFQQGAADEVVSVSFHDPSGLLKPEFRITALRSGRPKAEPAAVATAGQPSVAR
ncbi:hypothetical protein [Paludisphaera soli]|uniref:hypothetical protein n=1 Tax=Paludisphaera soli TaxID=2712865 RepID=UPI0013ED3A27|nr:hypothetical protein [Paludisphaera soli]